MIQTPAPDDFLLKWRGDVLTVTLELPTPRPGRAALRTNLGHAQIRREEIIAETEMGLTPLARAWSDMPMDEVRPGHFRAEIPLDEVGVFSAKACFFPEGSEIPEWPEGKNFHVKVESAETRSNNAIYTVFPRQFGSFREVIRRLPVIMDQMGFRIVQTLPPFPVPTTYGVMGELGCPFAATDFLSVDPAMAEFDERVTPLGQFRELIGAVHARRGLLFIDLPANHTGWASTLQTHHPEWFRHEADGRFHSPGAWGVTWADLVELDYSRPELCAYMADVFLFWCRNGVDGFRCDAGYMIPVATWKYIVAKVREEYPDTVFMLEGLGGELAITDELLSEANLDWAYSELFQTYDRRGFEWYLPGAIRRSQRYGALVHFAETHDNDRLAKGGKTYARLRVQLAALLSWQGAWGIANGVEWYATEKIDVHAKNDLNWDAEDNMIGLIARLNGILRAEPSFAGPAKLGVITRGGGNTLAVMRGELLVLANLDCGAPVTIDWDRERFAASEARDLLSGANCSLAGPLKLEAGEVRCLKRATDAASVPDAAAPAALPAAAFHLVLPRDVRRDAIVPEGEQVELSAAHDFRVRLIEIDTHRTVLVERSRSGKVVFLSPRYQGDGTRCRELRMEVSIYLEGRAERVFMRYLVPPKSEQARMRLKLDGEAVRRHPEYRTILSNGAGASAQLRLGWGSIHSAYDAILAANPNAEVPSDRLNLWARTRVWLQREGYVRELDSKCVTDFTADPAGRFARWHFTAPCGMGKVAAFVFEIALAPGVNLARLKVTRVTAPEASDDRRVRLVFRPDIEWRSFHATTKAYAGAEELFPRATKAKPEGFDFSPYDGVFRFRVRGGVYHHEPAWAYNIAHAEDAGRGLSPAGDLFSPGWISADLKIGESVELIGGYLAEEREALPAFPALKLPADEWALPLAEGLREAMKLYLVRRDRLKTVIAGYPWFLDWGRDTFIFMRGMIAAGMTEDAKKILLAFAEFEERGTLPNIIYGKTAGNRDTTDAQLWFIRCVRELETKMKKSDGVLRKTCASIVNNYLKGTPNGIRVDGESSLVWSPSHFTWMDTNYPACTPRVGYPVEIEALWISALEYLELKDLADRARESVRRLFKTKVGYCDVLAAPNGERAAMATPDAAVRPNQLFLYTLGVLDDPTVIDATEELLVPGALRSLGGDNPAYRGTYEGDENSSRKPAYHNGTAWAWPFPSFVEALAMSGRVSPRAALDLLASAVENLNTGAIGHLSEIVDGDSPHAQKGCAAQAWSDSELLRVWLICHHLSLLHCSATSEDCAIISK